MLKDIPIFHAFLTPSVDGVRKISLVEKPATKQLFVAYKETPQQVKYSTIEDKHIVTGVVMLADTPIYSRNESVGYHYAVYSKETVKQMAIQFFKSNLNSAVDTEHMYNVSGLTLIESFITDTERGIVAPASLGEVTEGSWIVSFYVENDKIWDEIKKGIFKGFSLTGIFFFKQEIEQKLSSPTSKIEKEIEEIANKILHI